ncbi:hypothetical protein [Burkholderia pseudomallei]|uniref:hypothetical protein n=1 Tax=Burkholderia pseudomallei TaxID=28450 RepID=UPI0012AEB958|nr:hypothetical protein [Burkholderia pseudomallei]
MLDLQLGELAHGVPQNQNRGKTILGYTDGHMQTPALGGFPRLSPDAKIPQRLIQRAFSGFQGMTTEIGMARPAGIEPATPAFGGQITHRILVELVTTIYQRILIAFTRSEYKMGT